eukprot:155231-Chlamydomonas_euryale.AAC.6
MVETDQVTASKQASEQIYMHVSPPHSTPPLSSRLSMPPVSPFRGWTRSRRAAEPAPPCTPPRSARRRRRP